MKLDVVSRYRDAIYGFSILWIVIFHGDAINKVDWTFGHEALEWVAAFFGVGNVGVDIFLFLSGICLYFSFHKNPSTANFIKKRLARIVLPCLFIYTLYWFIRFVIIQGDLSGFLLSMTLMRFWVTGDQTMWFVSLIIVLYFAYPYIYHFLFDSGKHYILRVAILLAASYLVIYLIRGAAGDLYDQVEIALTRVSVFIMGCFTGKYVFEKRKLPKWCVVLFIAAIAVFIVVLYFDVLHGMWRRFFYAVGGVGLSYVLAWVFAALAACGKKFAKPRTLAISRFFGWVGLFSLELYLSHIMVNQVLRLTAYYQPGSATQYCAVIVVAILLAWVAMKATTPFIKKITVVPKQIELL